MQKTDYEWIMLSEEMEFMGEDNILLFTLQANHEYLAKKKEDKYIVYAENDFEVELDINEPAIIH